jgi:imidazoleglycerol phosphate dehydratase HisB
MASASQAGSFQARSATVSRVTNETKIEVSLSLDTHPTFAPQTINVKTGIGFLDHVSRVDLALSELCFAVDADLDGCLRACWGGHRCCMRWPSTEACH